MKTREGDAETTRGWSAACRTSAPRYWPDGVLLGVLASLTGIVVYQAARIIDFFIYGCDTFLSPITAQCKTMDVWFGSDVPRVFGNMATRWSLHYRTDAHPLFALIAHPPVYILNRVLGVELTVAVRSVIAGLAAVWIGMVFGVLRLVGCRRTDAVVFSALAAASASAMFWLVVTETYSWGSVTILVALGVVALAQHRKLSPVWFVGVSAATLSFTVTNWMAGIVATMTCHTLKRTIQITAGALLLVVILWGVQSVIFPDTAWFIGTSVAREVDYADRLEAGRVGMVWKSFVFHSMVMPKIKFDMLMPDRPMLWTQNSAPGSASVWGAAAVVLWGMLLVLGLWALVRLEQHRRFRVALGLTVLGQLALHTVYGDETLLYSLHFGPLLVLITALATLTPARRVALTLAVMLLVSAGVNNILQFREAQEIFQRYAIQHYELVIPGSEPLQRVDGSVNRR